MKRGSTTVLACIAGIIATGATSGCGYRVVKRSDVTARKFAADSATMTSLERQIDAIRAKCRADSLLMASDLAAARTPAAPTPAPTAPDSLLKARDVEIETLKDQLTRANAELDRIKRRLANPRS